MRWEVKNTLVGEANDNMGFINIIEWKRKNKGKSENEKFLHLELGKRQKRWGGSSAGSKLQSTRVPLGAASTSRGAIYLGAGSDEEPGGR